MSYEVILGGKHRLGELVENLSLKDSLDQIAYEASFQLAIPAAFPGITPGQSLEISGVPDGETKRVILLSPGVVWEIGSTSAAIKHIQVTAYDRTIYLAKSDHECLFPAGQTASQRLSKYAAEWEIPLASIPDTATELKKAIYRAQPIYNMITSDLRETAKAGGAMFIPRMTPAGLQLVRIGGNTPAWKLELAESITQTRTLEGAATQVKVLGMDEGQGSQEVPSKVLAIAKGETAKYGTLQRLIQDPEVKSLAAAKKLAQDALCGPVQNFSVTGPDMIQIRAGDAVTLNSMALIVTSVSHELGHPGRMELQLSSLADVKRRYFIQNE